MSPEALMARRLCCALKRVSPSNQSGELWNGIVLKGGSLAPEEISLCWRHAPSIAMKLPASETCMAPNQEGAPFATGKRLVHEIRRRDVIALVEAIAVDRPVMANRTLGILSKLFNWLVARDVIAASPVHGVEMPGVEKAGDRALDDNEIATLWRACADEGVVGAAVRIMLLTAARRTEVSAMRWAEINEEKRTWLLPSERSKNRQTHVVPLSTAAWEIIAALPRISDTHVFSTSGNGPVVNFCRIKERLDAKLKFEKHWQFHDLRRSCASGLQRLGVRVEVIEATLGHRSGVFRGITSIYQRHDFADEKRAALEAWGRHVEGLVIRTSANVLPLRKMDKTDASCRAS